MSAGDQPSATPPASQPAANDESPASQPGSDGAPDSSAPATDPSPAPADSSAAPASSSSPDATPADTSPDSAPSSAAPDSTQGDNGDCAEIPPAAHVILSADIKFLLQIPRAIDDAKQLPHKFTLTSDDGTVSQTLTLAADAVAGDVDGTSLLTFSGLAEHHAYTLQCDNGDTTYAVFQDMAYETMSEAAGAQDDAAAAAGPPSDPAGESAAGTGAT